MNIRTRSGSRLTVVSTLLLLALAGCGDATTDTADAVDLTDAVDVAPVQDAVWSINSDARKLGLVNGLRSF